MDVHPPQNGIAIGCATHGHMASEGFPTGRLAEETLARTAEELKVKLERAGAGEEPRKSSKVPRGTQWGERGAGWGGRGGWV